MSDATTVMDRLDKLSEELDELSKGLAYTERLLGGYVDENGEEIKGVEREYDDWLDVFEVGLWTAHTDEEAKLPSEAMRLRLARRQMPTDLLGRYSSLIAKRKRMEKRIGSVKVEIDAQRSILSALKMEAEASGAGLRRAA